MRCDEEELDLPFLSTLEAKGVLQGTQATLSSYLPTVAASPTTLTTRYHMIALPTSVVTGSYSL